LRCTWPGGKSLRRRHIEIKRTIKFPKKISMEKLITDLNKEMKRAVQAPLPQLTVMAVLSAFQLIY
jgi:hypothetical protein